MDRSAEVGFVRFEVDVYGLNPDNVKQFAHLRGGEVLQVCVGSFDLQFHLHPTGRVSIWSRCELRATNGEVIDVWRQDGRSEKFCAFVDLLGATIADVSIDNSTTLRLQFSDGRQLLLLDDSPQFESFSVDNIIV